MIHYSVLHLQFLYTLVILFVTTSICTTFSVSWAAVSLFVERNTELVHILLAYVNYCTMYEKNVCAILLKHCVQC